MTTRQITDAAAPFPSIDEALSAAELFVRQQPGASFVGAAAERQHGGFFVRVKWTTPAAGSRGRRNRHHSHVAEIGKIEAHERLGFEGGQLCRRGGCRGMIEVDLNDRPWCPECQWESEA